MDVADAAMEPPACRYAGTPELGNDEGSCKNRLAIA